MGWAMICPLRWCFKMNKACLSWSCWSPNVRTATKLVLNTMSAHHWMLTEGLMRLFTAVFASINGNSDVNSLTLITHWSWSINEFPVIIIINIIIRKELKKVKLEADGWSKGNDDAKANVHFHWLSWLHVSNLIGMESLYRPAGNVYLFG